MLRPLNSIHQQSPKTPSRQASRPHSMRNVLSFTVGAENANNRNPHSSSHSLEHREIDPSTKNSHVVLRVRNCVRHRHFPTGTGRDIQGLAVMVGSFSPRCVNTLLPNIGDHVERRSDGETRIFPTMKDPLNVPSVHPIFFDAIEFLLHVHRDHQIWRLISYIAKSQFVIALHIHVISVPRPFPSGPSPNGVVLRKESLCQRSL